MAIRFCPNCGKENTENLNFCGNCGTNFAKEKIEEPILIEQTVPQTVSEEEQSTAAQPAEKVQDAEPEQPVQTAQPVQEEQPAQPAQPVQPAQQMQMFQPVKPVRRGKGLGIASMVIGILAILNSVLLAALLWFFPSEIVIVSAVFVGILSVASLVLGIVSLCKGYKKGCSISGVIMSSLALLLCVASVILSLYFDDTMIVEKIIDELPDNGRYHRSLDDLEDYLDDYDDYYDDYQDKWEDYYSKSY